MVVPSEDVSRNPGESKTLVQSLEDLPVQFDSIEWRFEGFAKSQKRFAMALCNQISILNPSVPAIFTASVPDCKIWQFRTFKPALLDTGLRYSQSSWYRQNNNQSNRCYIIKSLSNFTKLLCMFSNILVKGFRATNRKTPYDSNSVAYDFDGIWGFLSQLCVEQCALEGLKLSNLTLKTGEVYWKIENSNLIQEKLLSQYRNSGMGFGWIFGILSRIKLEDKLEKLNFDLGGQSTRLTWSWSATSISTGTTRIFWKRLFWSFSRQPPTENIF